MPTLAFGGDYLGKHFFLTGCQDICFQHNTLKLFIWKQLTRKFFQVLHKKKGNILNFILAL